MQMIPLAGKQVRIVRGAVVLEDAPRPLLGAAFQVPTAEAHTPAIHAAAVESDAVRAKRLLGPLFGAAIQG